MAAKEKQQQIEDAKLLAESIEVERENQPQSFPFGSRQLAKRQRPAYISKFGSPGQPQITNFRKVKKIGKKSQQQRYFDAELALMLSSTGQSFNLVKKEGFKRFLNFLMPEANIKVPNTFSQ